MISRLGRNIGRSSSRLRSKRRWPQLLGILRRMIPLLLLSTTLVPFGCKSTTSGDRQWWQIQSPFKKSTNTKAPANDPICPPVEGAELPPPSHHSQKIGVDLGAPTPYVNRPLSYGSNSSQQLPPPAASQGQDQSTIPVSWQKVN